METTVRILMYFPMMVRNGFECLMSETVNGNGYQSARGVYVDNTLYVVKGNIIEAYDMADYQKIDDLIL